MEEMHPVNPIMTPAKAEIASYVFTPPTNIDPVGLSCVLLPEDIPVTVSLLSTTRILSRNILDTSTVCHSSSASTMLLVMSTGSEPRSYRNCTLPLNNVMERKSKEDELPPINRINPVGTVGRKLISMVVMMAMLLGMSCSKKDEPANCGRLTMISVGEKE